MRTAGLMLLWPLWLRHRLALSLAFAGVLASALTTSLLPSGALLSPSLLAVLLVPVAVAAFTVVKVFCFAVEAQIEVAESCFPARLWALPVGTATLAGWPMLAGQVVVALLWTVVALGIMRPWGIPAPILCPALLFSATLAWLQALLWWPFPLPWLRLCTLVALGAGLAGALALFQQVGVVDESVLTALGAGMLGLAYPVAMAGLAQARRGGVTPWEIRLPRGWLAYLSVWRGKHFSRAEEAQLWVEWRRSGLALPLSTLTYVLLFPLMILPTRSFLEDLEQSGQGPLGRHLILVGNLVPVLMALLFALILAPGLGSEMGRMSLKRGKPPSSFFLARPLASAALLRAKVLAAAMSVLATQLVLIVAFMCWLGLASPLPAVQEGFRALGQILSPAQQVSLALLFILALPLLTWLYMLMGMWSGLLGRSWAEASNGLSMLFSVGLVIAGILAARNPSLLARLPALLPWLALGAATAKLVAFVGLCRLVRRRQLLSWATLLAMAALWTALAAGLSAFALSLCPISSTTISLVVLGIVLTVPLTRPLLSPLALKWSRHS